MVDHWELLDRALAPGAADLLRAGAERADRANPRAVFRDPFRIALLFLSCLAGSNEDPELQDALRLLVTPESRAGFGDFRSARERLASIDRWAVGDCPVPAFQDPEVVYVKLLSGVVVSFRVESEQLVLAAAVITLVWRSQPQRWMVHAFGPPEPPSQVPRLTRRRHR